ncbi:MAG TPA: Ku protein [Bryobacteraceae bacterium]|nr:Ku protein [Bryobacteraceae bacterium]HOQ43819.1 Ku protein [Bryobacteraceae bacterium]HPQ14800.1 Ku protein [Bryobacteraceae bacterium]HPU71738.1 Ku protein [Bryobacteraceae bacterium]
MAQTVWKGYLTFGLISVPVRLFAAARREHVSFHMLHNVCGTRIRQQLYCPHCERTVERSEIVKGYPESKDTFVVVTPEELKAIAPPSERSMDIVQFVHVQEIDPLYFDVSYYALPEEPGRKAYQLLVQTMQKSGYAAIAKVAMHQREYIVLIRPRANGLTLHTIYYPEELNQLAEYGKPGAVEIRPQEVELAERLVENLAAPFEPEKFQDEYRKRVLELIEAKREGKEVRAAPPAKVAPVIDLMEALQKSLAAAGRKPPERAEELQPAKAERKRPAKKKRLAS